MIDACTDDGKKSRLNWGVEFLKCFKKFEIFYDVNIINRKMEMRMIKIKSFSYNDCICQRDNVANCPKHRL